MKKRITNTLVVLSLIAILMVAPLILALVLEYTLTAVVHYLYTDCIYIESYYEPLLCEDSITVKRYYLTNHQPWAVICIGERDSIVFKNERDLMTAEIIKSPNNDTLYIDRMDYTQRDSIYYHLSRNFMVGSPTHIDNDGNINLDRYFVVYSFGECRIYYNDPNNPTKDINRKAHRISKHRIKVKRE